MTGAGSAATCTVGCGVGAGAEGCVVSTGAGTGVTGAGATAISAGGVIPGSGMSTSGRSSDVADDGVVSTAFVICRSSGELEAITATGAGIETIFGPPIIGVPLT